MLSRRSEGRPRIALVLPGLGSGGLERVVADLARALPGRGYAAGVFCTSKLGVHADALRRAGIPVWNCRDPSFRIPGLPIRLIARLRGFGPSIVHAQSGAWLPATVACAALDGADLVFTEHGRDLRQPRWRTLADRWCARRTRRVTAVSTEAALRLQALVALDAAPDVIHNGVAPESTPRRSRAEVRAALGLSDELLALSVGRLESIKNHALLIEALSLLDAAHPVRAAIVGKGMGSAAARSSNCCMVSKWSVCGNSIPCSRRSSTIPRFDSRRPNSSRSTAWKRKCFRSRSC